MKKILLALSIPLLSALGGCAGVRVENTTVASGATDPKAIYIRPFDINYVDFRGHHSGGAGERPIRESLAPTEFARALKEELAKLAPARVLKDDEAPRVGWVVEGSIQLVDAGNPALRGALPPPQPLGRSKIRIHVRVLDVSQRVYAQVDAKDMGSVSETRAVRSRGNVLYEFDLAGGSRLSAAPGSIYAPGLGYATPFDYRNAAERVMMALSVDPHRYGVRTSPTIR
ncbi:MAG: hypothetical protein M3O82_08830 [Verrucomicrobiota bacterium]|nr:hypothetical protein [Verrucomicrobiota bacterium]